MSDTPTPKQIADGCKHFNGLQHDVCAAGVTYNSLPRPIPCLPKYGGDVAACPLIAFQTDAEIDAEEARSKAAVRAFLAKLAADICPHCDTPIERRRQVGRCVYAEPCGHRLYQGRLKS